MKPRGVFNVEDALFTFSKEMIGLKGKRKGKINNDFEFYIKSLSGSFIFFCFIDYWF
jgi:hypothetical protein